MKRMSTFAHLIRFSGDKDGCLFGIPGRHLVEPSVDVVDPREPTDHSARVRRGGGGGGEWNAWKGIDKVQR